MRRIDYVAVHCTATKEGADFGAKDIDRWHKAKGWKGIGYHYVIRLSGEVEKGRPVTEIGAHVSGYNLNSIGVVYVGGLDAEGHPKDTRTPAQKAALVKLLKVLKSRYPRAVIQGHRDFPNVHKACPSFDARTEYKNISYNA